MSRNFSRLASAIAIACATVSVPAFAQDHSGHHAGMSASEHDAAKLHALFERSEAEALDRNPITAFFRGDFSDADKLGDFSPASYASIYIYRDRASIYKTLTIKIMTEKKRKC